MASIPEKENSKKNWIQFVGTAGARFVVARQLRSSGGLWFSLQGVNLYMDPGPGALVRCLTGAPRLDPRNLDGILLSHKHLDHSGDVNAMIEAMTEGGYQSKGILFAPEDALEGDPVVLRYVRKYLAGVQVLKVNTEYRLGAMTFSTAGTHHHSVETYGFNFRLPGKTLSYITDTEYFPELLAQYPGEILMLNVVLMAKIPGRRIDHLSIEDVRLILRETRAKTVVMTHFGTRVVEAAPSVLADRLSQESGLQVIAARDGMVLELDTLVPGVST